METFKLMQHASYEACPPASLLVKPHPLVWKQPQRIRSSSAEQLVGCLLAPEHKQCKQSMRPIAGLLNLNGICSDGREYLAEIVSPTEYLES